MRLSPEVRFGLAFLGGFAFLSWLTLEPSPVPLIDPLVQRLTEAQTAVSAALLTLAGQAIGAQGTLLSGPRFSCEVGSGCSGVQPLILAWAALLAFPATWRARLLGVLLLTPAILLVNVGRIVGLWLAGAYRPDLFDLGHVYVGQVALIFVTAGLWWHWARRQLVPARGDAVVRA